MKPLIYIICLFVISGCTNNIAVNDAVFGNWYSCGKDGLYIEMITKGDLFKYSTGEGRISKWSKFKIEGDTLIQYDSDLYEDSVVVNKAIINHKLSDELTIDYLTSEEVWTFYRINETVTKDNDLMLSNETKARAVKQKCTDQRSQVEIIKDSLEMQKDLLIF